MRIGKLTSLSSIELGSSSVKIDNIDGYINFIDSGHPTGITITDILANQAVAGWTTLVDLDFTSQGDVSLTSDGNYTVGGVPFIKIKSSSDASAAYIDSTGLVLTPAASTDIPSNGVITAPGILFDMHTLLPTFDINMGVRASIYISSFNGSTGYHAVGLAFGPYTAGTYAMSNTWWMAYKRGYYNGTAGFYYASNASGWTFVSQALGASNNVIILENSNTLRRANVAMYGQYSNGFPIGSNIKPLVDTWSPTTIGAMPTTNWGVVIGAHRVESGTAIVAKIARVKIEVLRG